MNLCRDPGFVDRLRLHVQAVETPLQRRQGFTVYGLQGCPYCAAAIEALRGRPGPPPALRMLAPGATQADKARLLSSIQRRHAGFDATRHKTFPVIFQGDRFLGGYSDLLRALGLAR